MPPLCQPASERPGNRRAGDDQRCDEDRLLGGDCRAAPPRTPGPHSCAPLPGRSNSRSTCPAAGEGDPAGIHIPAHNPPGPTVGFIGVIPEQRGRGCAYDLFAECAHLLDEQGAEFISAATDRANSRGRELCQGRLPASPRDASTSTRRATRPGEEQHEVSGPVRGQARTACRCPAACRRTVGIRAPPARSRSAAGTSREVGSEPHRRPRGAAAGPAARGPAAATARPGEGDPGSSP